MARISKPYIVQQRNDSQTFILTLTIASGLPRSAPRKFYSAGQDLRQAGLVMAPMPETIGSR
jgi:hypothetical protein